MTRWNHLVAPALAVVLALAGAACGGGDDDDDAVTPSTEADGDDDGGTASGALSSIQDAEEAVVRIVAEGSFVEPGEVLGESFEVSGAGSGSGAILSEEGIVVTNNHVVAGAASLEVFVGGSDEGVSAKVLGVSECNDLAVIDLEGDGYPFLAWSDEEPDTGVEVRAAGYPLGDPEYTLTSGIVSKAEADGDMPWASIPSTIEHDAAIQPGNSGGPLLNAEDATIVGIDYATNDPGTGTNQFFAISSELAQEVVETLQAEEDVLSLGINPQAVLFEEEGVVGVWVASVASGSPAAEVGLQPGDIIEKIEGLSLATDGTMRDYCDILRSHDPDDVLSLQVLRFGEGVRLTGEFNGDELEPSESILEEVEEESGGDLETSASYTYETITDDSGQLIVDLPIEWSERATGTDEATGLPQISAAPSLEGFNNTFDTPGMLFLFDGAGALAPADVVAAIDYSEACLSDGPSDYADAAYIGQQQYWTDCGDSGATIVVIGAQPDDGSFTMAVLVQVLTTADAEALQRIIDTFRVVPQE